MHAWRASRPGGARLPALRTSGSYRPVPAFQKHGLAQRRSGPVQRRPGPPQRLDCAAAAQGKAGVEVVNPPAGGRLESTRLRESVRTKVEDAMEALGGRATVGDVSARAGVTIAEAEEALNALAADCLGNLQVSEDGDVLYAFPANFKAVIRGRSLMLRLAPLLAGVRNGAALLAKVSFGAALIASVALVWITIAAIASSGGDSDRDRNRGGNQGYYYGGRPGSYVWLDLSDLFWLSGPRRRPPPSRRPGHMNFLQAVFSFVFGDGDPNYAYEEQRWQLVGKYIQSRGGVVTAEELAPYLDPPDRAEGEPLDESFVVPALVRFGGSPITDKAGNLLYRFESLQRSAGGVVAPPTDPAALQNLWTLTQAEDGQKFGAAALGGANLLGVGILSGYLRSPGVAYQLQASSLGFVAALMPFLQAYAACFFLAPAVRWLLYQGRNRRLQAANRRRLARLRELRQPSPALKAKLASAQRQAKRTVIRDRDIVYRTDREVGDQQDPSAADFDRRLRELDGGGSSGSGSGRARGQRYGDWAPGSRPVDVESDWRGRSR